MIEQQRKRALQLAEEFIKGPDLLQRGEEYWKEWGRKFHEYASLVTPEVVAWLIKSYENSHILGQKELDSEGRASATTYVIKATALERGLLLKRRYIHWDEHERDEHAIAAFIRGKPVTVKLTWAMILGKPDLFCFWEPTSDLVDNYLIREWFYSIFPMMKQIVGVGEFDEILDGVLSE
jgi:hypothetical protein